MKLSILTLSYQKRVRSFLPDWFEHVSAQAEGRDDVEILALVDNQRVSIGSKWNALLAIARGRFVVRVGDDDKLADDYVGTICEAIESHPDVDAIVYDSDMYVDGKFSVVCHWGIEYEYLDEWEKKELWRRPGEIVPIRREIVQSARYPDVWQGRLNC